MLSTFSLYVFSKKKQVVPASFFAYLIQSADLSTSVLITFIVS
ncbi:hypothetical protein HMPREF0083_01860 [Aneurinibacillus aneurinilyticus ATCC 12856]|uniref:Uncharacterized protein n=1 Tax=Aneurinibacillus aneurinilyticus ATCC 12856 TaxID=649747 RepID=U1WNB2_ANEAE|nr:hypothetical protein HMPREF0083_01860 [Aneurinibacillus aneurinilyticus ATCC 12856]